MYNITTTSKLFRISLILNTKFGTKTCVKETTLTTRNETIGGKGGAVGGWGDRIPINSSPLREQCKVDTAKTEETVSHRQNDNVKEVGTPPVQCNLCTPLIALSTVERNKVTKTCSVRKASVEEQLQKDQPSSYENPAPPPSS